jgi:hypothetical protein
MQEVPRIDVTDSYRTLGVYLSPSGALQQQAKILRSESNHYLSAVSASTFTPAEAYTSYMLYLRPKLTYPVSCTSLTEKQCRYIQAPALAALLPIMHLNHHTPHAIIFGDPRYGGINLPDFYTVQGFQQLRLLIGHLSSQDDVGKMILIAISYLQLTLGVHRPFFIMQYSLFAKWIDKLWLTLVWQHTSQLQIVLEIEKQWMPHQPRTHDTFLMEYALTLNLLACSIKLINQCCLYLQVLTLSDLSSADGKHLLPSALSHQ